MSSPHKYTHSFPHRRQRIESPAAEGSRQQQQEARHPNLAQLQSEVNTELDIAVAEDVDERLAREQQQAAEAEVMKLSILANETMAPYKQSMANAGWYTKDWLANAMTKANNILADVPIPVVNLPVVPLVEYHNQLPAMSTLKSRGNKKWEKITMNEAQEARKVTDKNLESYSDEEGWEVVDRKDKGTESEKKSQIARIEVTIKQVRWEFDARKMEPIMDVHEMNALHTKITELEKQKEKLQKELEELEWPKAELRK